MVWNKFLSNWIALIWQCKWGALRSCCVHCTKVNKSTFYARTKFLQKPESCSMWWSQSVINCSDSDIYKHPSYKQKVTCFGYTVLATTTFTSFAGDLLETRSYLHLVFKILALVVGFMKNCRILIAQYHQKHQGGIGESMVKNVKVHLKRTTGDHTSIAEEFTTLLWKKC